MKNQLQLEGYSYTCEDVGHRDVDGRHDWIEQAVQEFGEISLLTVERIFIAARQSLHRRFNFIGRLEIDRMIYRPIGDDRQRCGFNAIKFQMNYRNVWNVKLMND